MEQEREGLLQTVEINQGGELHRATYFVENNAIYAQIAGQTMLSPVGNIPAADTVRTVVERAPNPGRVTNQAKRWLSTRWLSHEEPGHGA